MQIQTTQSNNIPITYRVAAGSSTLRGFSLLELLIVIAIISILAVAGAGSYRGFGKSVQLTSATQTIAADLRQTQAKSMVGESGLFWGVHFVSGTNNYYQIFSTPTNYANASTSIVSTTTLPLSITFSDPTGGATRDIIFSKISGLTTATSVSVVSEGVTKTITITSIGTIDN